MPLSCLKVKIHGGPDIPAMYTRPPSDAYQLSDKHGVYVKGGVTLPARLPPPRPPQKAKAELFDLADYQKVDERAIRVPLTILSKPVEALVQYLIEGYDDDISKARVLYRWLTNQPINRMHVLEHKPKESNSALAHLWLLKTKKQRYTKVFSTLCRYAGLYCVVIHGVVKGVHYQIAEKMDETKHYGEWNAVVVDGDWRLVDALWGTCDVTDPGDGRGRFVCDERFFFTDPKDLIYTHFALAERWQLLDSPRHMESFEQSACLKSRFFDLGMQILSHPLCEIQAQEGEVDLIFGCQPKSEIEQKFSCYISHFDRPETKRYLTRGSNSSVPIFIHRVTDSSVAVKVRFPEKGIYRLEVVAKQCGHGAVYKDYDWVAIYKVLVEEVAHRGFPKMDPIGWGPGSEITKLGLAPFNYTSGLVVAKSVHTKVRFKIVDTQAVQNMKFFFKMSSTYDNDYSVNTVSDRFEVDMNIMTFFIEAPPFGEYTLKMYARNVRGNVPPSQRREVNICNYLLISDVPQRETPLGVLTEKTEVMDDIPEPSMSHEPSKTEKLAEPTESIVSASHVSVEPEPEPRTENMRDTPEIVKMSDTSGTHAEETKPAKAEGQTFVRVDENIQEIPEIPLDVVKPISEGTDTERTDTEKIKEMKVVSTNRVVPLNQSGGDDESVMLVPADDKGKRPKTGFKRARDDIKFYTALARVRGESS